MNKSDFDIIHDLGCGEGKFLNEVKKKFKKKILTGSDISKISVQNAKKKYPFLNKNIIQSDAQKINKWGNWLIKRYNINKKILLSMWFIIHEFSRINPKKL